MLTLGKERWENCVYHVSGPGPALASEKRTIPPGPLKKPWRVPFPPLASAWLTLRNHLHVINVIQSARVMKVAISAM